MSTCVTNKKIYLTREIAEDVLIELWTKFDYAPNNGPVAVYQCEDCGYFHLTSQGPMDERLAEHLTTGKIQRQKEANRWMDKIKKR